MRKILIQLDTDKHASSFDRVVAVDAGVDEVFAYHGVTVEDVEALVHGAIFTRKQQDLSHTAIFVGGRNVTHAEELLAAVQKAFFGPFRVSVLLDASGANTTAAAAVLAARAHLNLAETSALVLAGTGPVGQRVAYLLAREGAAVWLGSRTIERARDAADRIKESIENARVFPIAMANDHELRDHPERFKLVVAAGAAGTRLLHRAQLEAQSSLAVLIDLNAVPPSGIEGVGPTDFAREEGGRFHYGAIGVGGMKMKIHRAAVARLFTANNLVLDAAQVYDLGQSLG